MKLCQELYNCRRRSCMSQARLRARQRRVRVGARAHRRRQIGPYSCQLLMYDWGAGTLRYTLL